MVTRPEKEQWHLDKKVPLGLILAIFVQTAGFAWWAATVDARIGTSEHRIEAMEQASTSRFDQVSQIENRLTRLETNSTAQLDTLRRIETTLDRLIWEQRHPPGEDER